MGSITSRPNVGVQDIDYNVNNAYKYPPKSGTYFSNHFIMGGERFDTAYPEMYLFGENMDLNFLGSKPSPFPYPAPSPGEPSRSLRALINIRKDSVRFVRVSDDICAAKENDSSHPLFNIEFIFDCDVRCSITILYFCAEEITSNGLVFTPKDASMNSETYYYKPGAAQQFSQVCHVFDPSKYSEESLLYCYEKEIFPIVIYCVAEEGEVPVQCHATIAVVEKHSDDYTLKPLKQKIFVDGLCYLLQEIYGIENKNPETKPTGDEDHDENGAECVICMCDLRDTLILPCRHLCLCNCCADSLRYQANNCPICRVPFRALLQIKALQKAAPGTVPSNAETTDAPAGYESVTLIEALNGPSAGPPLQPVAPPAQNMYVQLSQNAPQVDQLQDDFRFNDMVYLPDLRGIADKEKGCYEMTTIKTKDDPQSVPGMVKSESEINGPTYLDGQEKKKLKLNSQESVKKNSKFCGKVKDSQLQNKPEKVNEVSLKKTVQKITLAEAVDFVDSKSFKSSSDIVEQKVGNNSTSKFTFPNSSNGENKVKREYRETSFIPKTRPLDRDFSFKNEKSCLSRLDGCSKTHIENLRKSADELYKNIEVATDARGGLIQACLEDEGVKVFHHSSVATHQSLASEICERRDSETGFHSVPSTPFHRPTIHCSPLKNTSGVNYQLPERIIPTADQSSGSSITSPLRGPMTERVCDSSSVASSTNSSSSTKALLVHNYSANNKYNSGNSATM